RGGGAVSPVRRIQRPHAGERAGGDRRGEAAGVPGPEPPGEQDRLSQLLGAAALLGRVLPRGPYTVRVDDAREPALLRVDPGVDTHLPGGLRRTGGTGAARAGAARQLREILLPWTLERWREAHQGDQRQGAQDRGTPGGGVVGGGEVGARRGGAAGERSAAAEPAARLHLPLLAGLGDGQHGGHGGAVRAGGAGHLRLSPGVFLAGAGAGPAQPC